MKSISFNLTPNGKVEQQITAECLGITRADLLEQEVRSNNLTLSVAPVLKQPPSNQKVEQLTVLAEQVSTQLELGK